MCYKQTSFINCSTSFVDAFNGRSSIDGKLFHILINQEVKHIWTKAWKGGPILNYRMSD